jgi:hypothetical protein
MFGFLVILGWPLTELSSRSDATPAQTRGHLRVTFQVGAPDVGFMPNSNR